MLTAVDGRETFEGKFMSEKIKEISIIFSCHIIL